MALYPFFFVNYLAALHRARSLNSILRLVAKTGPPKIRDRHFIELRKIIRQIL